MYTKDNLFKYISKDKLKKLLDQLPENCKYLKSNTVENLTLLDKDLNYLGFICVGNEVIELSELD